MNDVANRLSILATAVTQNTTQHRRSCELIIDFDGVAEHHTRIARQEQRYGSVIDFDRSRMIRSKTRACRLIASLSLIYIHTLAHTQGR